MFIPIGHDQGTINRLPWVTFTIMGLCCVMFLATLGAQSRSMARAERLLGEIGEYFFANPDLELDPEIEDDLLSFIPEYQDQREAFKEFLKESTSGAGVFADATEGRPPKEKRQEVLDDLMRRFDDAISNSPYYEWGLVPSEQSPISYLTYQFMHGGWLHLIFNMLFLYLAGPYIEDVWGRPLYAVFYLGAGVLSALFFVLRYPSSDVPLIGASGAIAGVMGAFLIRYGRTKIKFMMMILLRIQFIDLPAWIILPLWVLREFFFGQAVDFAGGEGTGVAHWAHVAGFVVGVITALAIRQLGVEKKVQAHFVQYENTLLDEALEAVRDGERERAAELLKTRLKEAPTDMDAAAAYWDVQRDLGDVTPAVHPLLRACREALRDGQEEFVAPRWNEILDLAPEGAIDTMTAVRVGEILGKDLFPEVLLATVSAGLKGARPNTPAMVLARLARVGATVGGNDTVECARRALQSEDLPDDLRQELEQIVESVPAEPQQSAWAEEPEATYDGPVTHRLKVMEAVPEAWQAQRLTVDIQGESRRMSMAQVQAIAVGGIAEPDGKAYIVVDLLLDGPWSDRRDLRTVRLKSNTFNPTKLVDVDDPKEAFRLLVQGLLDVSGAMPLPDPDAVLGRPFRRFASCAEYEREVLGIGGDIW